MQQANLFAVMQPFILSDVVAHPVNHVLCDNLLNIACQKSDFREDYFFSVRLKNLQYGTVGAKKTFFWYNLYNWKLKQRFPVV